jgi:cytochrome P450
MEGEIALDRLLSRYDDIRLADAAPLTYRRSTFMRGLQALPVTVGVTQPNNSIRKVS